MTLNEVRKFYADVMKKHGIQVLETCDPENLWSISYENIDDQKNEICSYAFIDWRYAKPQSIKTACCFSTLSQEDLWMNALLKMHTTSIGFCWEKIRESTRRRNKDGIIEIRTNVNFVFVCDVRDCKSWEEIALKYAIASGDN